MHKVFSSSMKKRTKKKEKKCERKENALDKRNKYLQKRRRGILGEWRVESREWTMDNAFLFGKKRNWDREYAVMNNKQQRTRTEIVKYVQIKKY
jgi:hypothetical protein